MPSSRRADTSKPAISPTQASTGSKTSTARISPAPMVRLLDDPRRRPSGSAEQGFAVCCGTAGDMDFINSIARARGMEQVLMDLIDDNPVYLEIMQARFDFYYHMHRRMLEAAEGLIDFTHVGDDLGNQRGPMISLAIFDRHFAPKYEAVFRDGPRPRGQDDDAHLRLRRAFLAAVGRDRAGRLRRGPADDAADGHRRAAKEDRRPPDVLRLGLRANHDGLGHGRRTSSARFTAGSIYFPKGGLFLGPTHAIQVGSPLENILALYRTAGSLAEKVDASILNVAADGTDPDKISLSKLF